MSDKNKTRDEIITNLKDILTSPTTPTDERDNLIDTILGELSSKKLRDIDSDCVNHWTQM